MWKITEASVRMTGVWTENRKWGFLNEERGGRSKSNYDRAEPTLCSNYDRAEPTQCSSYDRAEPTQCNKWLYWRNHLELCSPFRSQNCKKQILASSCLSVRSPTRCNNSGFFWTESYQISYLTIFRKSFQINFP